MRCARPSSDSDPFATHGVSRPADADPAERHVEPRARRAAKSQPCSQIQRSACSAPQLCPTMPGQPASSIGSRPGELERRRRSARAAPGSSASCAAAACGRASRGAGGGARAPRRRSAATSGPARSSPSAAAGPMRARPPISIQPPGGTRRSSGCQLVHERAPRGVRRRRCTTPTPSAACPGALVDRVADPHPHGLARRDGAQVEGLVHPGSARALPRTPTPLASARS